MLRLILVLCFISSSALAEDYDEYKTYDTFTELDKYQRDFGLIFLPGLMYSNIEENNEISGATVSDRKRGLIYYDVRLGYIFHSGFYFGILYGGESQDINNSQPMTSRESVGMSFGYMRRGWAFTGTFYPYSKQTLENTTDISAYTEGLGYQLDAAYYFRIGSHFSFGPQLVFKSFRYGKGENATTSVNNDASSQHDVFTPMITIMINLYRG